MKTLTVEERNKKLVKIINIVFTIVAGTGAILYAAKAITMYAEKMHIFGM